MQIDWWPWYEMYTDELCAIARMQYEHYRNRYSVHLGRRFPDAVFPEYRVDVKRYGDDIWMGLIRNCFSFGIDPSLGMLVVNNRNARRMPWPDKLWGAIEFHIEEIRPVNGIAKREPAFIKELVSMDSMDDRRAYIKDKSRTRECTDSDRLVHRFCLGEYEKIASDRMHTAAGLYGFLDRSVRCSLLKRLGPELITYLEKHCPAALS